MGGALGTAPVPGPENGTGRIGATGMGGGDAAATGTGGGVAVVARGTSVATGIEMLGVEVVATKV